MRTGIGYDIHRLTPTIERSSIPLGGILISCHFNVDAYSDGDVLLHATVDALLGSLALGDIGRWFPDSESQNKNRSSSDFVKEVLKKVSTLGWEPAQLDSVILLEEPKLSDHSDSIRKNLAGLLNLDLSLVSVKAKSSEGLGPVGERRAIACHTIVALRKRSK